MPAVLICSPVPLQDELGQTMLYRQDFERVSAEDVEAALVQARTRRPDVVLVDSGMLRALWLVEQLRQEPATQRLSIAVLARGRTGGRHMEFIDAGANDILRLPAGPEWDERLVRLIRVPGRKEVRFPLGFEVRVTLRGSATEITAQGLNLGAGGLLVESPRPLKVGDHMRIAFRLPNSGLSVAGTGWVVREAGERRYGLEFLYLEDDGLDQVRHFVETWTAPS